MDLTTIENPGFLKDKSVEEMEDLAARKQRGEAVQYYRIYISEWESKGWIEKIPNTKKYSITDEGRTVLEVFCPEKLISFREEDIVLQTLKSYSD